MLQSRLVRILLLALTGVVLSQATPISLGMISFNDVGYTRTATAFKINNWTEGLIPGFSVVTPVSFLNVSLTIDRVGGTSAQGVTIANAMGASYTPYVSNDLDKTWQITRAVFEADLTPAAIWSLVDSRYATPFNSHLQLVLLPSSGPFLQANLDTWEIVVDTHTPEPAAWLLSAVGLFAVGVILRRRRA